MVECLQPVVYIWLHFLDELCGHVNFHDNIVKNFVVTAFSQLLFANFKIFQESYNLE